MPMLLRRFTGTCIFVGLDVYAQPQVVRTDGEKEYPKHKKQFHLRAALAAKRLGKKHQSQKSRLRRRRAAKRRYIQLVCQARGRHAGYFWHHRCKAQRQRPQRLILAFPWVQPNTCKYNLNNTRPWQRIDLTGGGRAGGTAATNQSTNQTTNKSHPRQVSDMTGGSGAGGATARPTSQQEHNQVIS